MGSSTYGSRSDSVNITDAHEGASADLRSREKRYGITMAFRVACFIAMIWVPNPYRWVLLAAAAILPYVAVIVANQADQRRRQTSFERGGPGDRPELTQGQTTLLPPSQPQPGSDDDQDTGTDPHVNGRRRD